MAKHAEKSFCARGSQMRLFFEIAEFLVLRWEGDKPTMFPIENMEAAFRRTEINMDRLGTQLCEEGIQAYVEALAGLFRTHPAMDHLDIDVTFLFNSLISCPPALKKLFTAVVSNRITKEMLISPQLA